MTGKNWKRFVDIVRNRTTFDVAPSLIIDSPWLPSFAGCDTKEYLFIQERWIDTNLKVLERFPDVIFLPGNWVEFGLVIEPSAFGCPLKWWKDTPPTALHIISDTSQISNLKVPNPETDGLMPVALDMQSYLEPKMADMGYPTRMVAARGPLAVASQLRGVTELLVDIKIEPEAAHDLINLCTESAISWLRAQKENIDKVEGILLLDDIVGMLSPDDYEEFAHPYLERIFSAFPDCIRAYHNDNPGYSFYDRLCDAGAEVLNFSHLDDISVLDNAIGNRMCLMGNLAPLEMLVNGTPEEVYNTSKKIISSVKHAFLLSAGGGASTGTKPENIDAMVEAVKSVI